MKNKYSSIRSLDRLVNLIDSIKFYDFKDFQVGAPLVVLLKDVNLSKYKYRELWNNSIYQENYRVKGNNGSIMFLYTNSYKGRKDYEQFFEKVAGLIEDKIVVVPNRGEMYSRFSVCDKILMFIWIIQLVKTKLSLKERLFCANLIMTGKKNFEEILNIIKHKNIQSIVTLCDLHMIDYLVVDYCNKCGIKTVTLQHGFLPSDDMFFRHSKSDFFLTYTDYTKKLGERFKKKRGVFLAVGMPEYIGAERVLGRKEKERKKFVVLLNGSVGYLHINNINMLEICMGYAKKVDCIFDVLPHPGTERDCLKKYKEIIGNKGKIIKRRDDLAVFFDSYKFCVANETTMILKAFYELAPVLLYGKKGSRPYLEMKIDKLSFSSYAEMENCTVFIEKNNINNFLCIIRDYLCGSDNIKEKYKKVLKNIS